MNESTDQTGSMKKCPSCGQDNEYWAQICRFCEFEWPTSTIKNNALTPVKILLITYSIAAIIFSFLASEYFMYLLGIFNISVLILSFVLFLVFNKSNSMLMKISEAISFIVSTIIFLRFFYFILITMLGI